MGRREMGRPGSLRRPANEDSPVGPSLKLDLTKPIERKPDGKTTKKSAKAKKGKAADTTPTERRRPPSPNPNPRKSSKPGVPGSGRAGYATLISDINRNSEVIITMAAMTFQAVLKRPDGTGTWTYLTIPFSVPDQFGGQGQVRVRGAIDGHPFRSTLLPAGDGTHYLVVKKAIRDEIGATAGATVTVMIEPDAEERSVTVPDDMQAALEQHPDADAAFARFAYSKQKEYVDWVEGAKRAETRSRRIESAMERIAAGLRLKG